MTARFAVPVIVALGFVVMLLAGAWVLRGTPGTLVNEAPGRIGPTPGLDGSTILVTVEEGDSAEEIGTKLLDAGVIESAPLFRVLTSLMGEGDHLAPGVYEFTRGTTALSAVQRISQGITAANIVTFPEGLRANEFAEILEQNGVAEAGFFRLAQQEQYQGSFLSEVPPGVGYEGFLFPATYGFRQDEPVHDVVQQMLDAFDQRYQEEILPRLPASGLSLYEIVTLASIVEREAQVPSERPIIASVFLNRLNQDFPLQADPTVQYALGSDPASVAEFGFWKQELSAADLEIASPYNTYVFVGLPPGPIANPGLDSILAALEPARTNYLFFVAREDGSHVFAETLEEHNTNVCTIYPERSEC